MINICLFLAVHGEANPFALWLIEKAGLAAGATKRVVRVLFQRNAIHGGPYYGPLQVYTLTRAMAGIFEL